WPDHPGVLSQRCAATGSTILRGADMSSAQYRYGPQVEPDGQTRFRIWAPDASAVTLELGDREPVPMQALADGWFEYVAACGPGTRYRFGVGTLSVPDPASRLQDRDVHAASVVVDPTSYTWQNTAWQGRPWHETVLYERHVGLLGGYAGVPARVPK